MLDLLIGEVSDVTAFGHILANQAVGIFVQPPLPGTVRVGEVYAVVVHDENPADDLDRSAGSPAAAVKKCACLCLLVFAAARFGGSLIAFSFSTSVHVSMGLLLFSGFGLMVLPAGYNTLLQTMVDDNKRGMVMSFYIMAFMGTLPLGSLLAGFLAHHIGPRYTLLIGGASCILGSGLFARKVPAMRKIVHPIYVKKSIIPEV